jgi:hypothetical protein
MPGISGIYIYIHIKGCFNNFNGIKNLNPSWRWEEVCWKNLIFFYKEKCTLKFLMFSASWPILERKLQLILKFYWPGVQSAVAWKLGLETFISLIYYGQYKTMLLESCQFILCRRKLFPYELYCYSTIYISASQVENVSFQSNFLYFLFAPHFLSIGLNIPNFFLIKFSRYFFLTVINIFQLTWIFAAPPNLD